MSIKYYFNLLILLMCLGEVSVFQIVLLGFNFKMIIEDCNQFYILHYFMVLIQPYSFDKLKMNEQRLEELFKKCGTVESVRIARNVNNQSRGFGFVLFSELDTEDDGTTQNSMHDHKCML